MNRYPLWKYILIAITLIVGFVYTLPNFYGEVPAVQISPVASANPVDAALKARVEGILRQSNLPAEEVGLGPNSVKVSFSNTDIQLKAKDILQSQLGENYVVALNLLSRSPH